MQLPACNLKQVAFLAKRLAIPADSLGLQIDLSTDIGYLGFSLSDGQACVPRIEYNQGFTFADQRAFHCPDFQHGAFDGSRKPDMSR